MSGELPVKAQCLPFAQIPHTTRLFTDFQESSPKLQPFYPRSPIFQQWLKDEASQIKYDSSRRQQVSNVLERQNKSWNASPQTLANLARLRKGAAAVVTGQQVGLFGGPLFSFFKALTAVKLAAQATSAGVDCVPIFWLATEDHDLAEINHTFIPGADAALEKFFAGTQGTTDAPVSALTLDPGIQQVVASAAELLGDSEASTLLRDCYQPGETLGNAFARLYARVFADWGVILLDAADPELHVIGEPIYRAAIERAAELDEALLARGKELEAAGYHQQVKVTQSSTLLFTLKDGARTPVHHRTNGSHSVDFVVGEEVVPQEEMLRRLATTPHHFSANVLLRPVLQDFLLPTLAYTGGAAEVAYFAQAAVVYQALLGRITPIIPRFSATIVETKLQGLLERYGLTLPDLFPGPEAVRQRMAAHALPQELQTTFDQASATLEKSLAAVRDSLARLDKTLVEAAENAGAKMHHQLTQLRERAARAETRQSDVLDRHAAWLSNTLYPHKALQEREIAGIYFLSRHGAELLRQLYEVINTECLDHQVISL